MTTPAEPDVPPPSMSDLLASCAAASAVSTPPSSDGHDAEAPEPRADDAGEDGTDDGAEADEDAGPGREHRAG